MSDLDVAGPELAPRARLVRPRTGLAVLVAMGLGNAANYGFHVVTGRFLGADAYGLLAGLLAIVAVVTVAASSLQTAAARAIASRPPGTTVRPVLVDPLTRSAMAVAGVLAAAVLAASPLLARFFGIGVGPVALLAAYLVPTAVVSISLGRLQGTERFGQLSWYSSGFAILKLAAGATAVAAGLGVTTVVALLVLLTAAAGAAGLVLTRDAGAVDGRALDSEVRHALVAFTLLWLMISADVPVARGLLDESQAGIYAAAAVLGKAVLWLPGVVATIAFPRLASAVSANRSTQDPMLQAFVLSLALCLAAVAGLFALGEPLYALFFGEEYRPAADLAWKIGLATIPLAIANLLVYHRLARGQSRFLVVLALGAAAELVGLFAVPADGDRFALVLFLAGTATAVALVPLGGWRWLRRSGQLARRRRPSPTA